VYVNELSRGLAKLGHTVDVFTRRESESQPEVESWSSGVRIVNVTAGPAEVLPKDDLWGLMPEFRSSLLRFMQSDGGRYDVLHGHFWLSGWVVAELRQLLGVPAVQTFHALGRTKRRHQGATDTSPSARLSVERRIVRDVDRVIAQCPAEERELVGDYGAQPAKLARIPGGVNLERFRSVDRQEARRELGLEPSGPLAVYVGRILPRKDVGNIIQALGLLARRLPEPPRLLVVGGESAVPDPVATPELGRLMALARRLGVDRLVTFTGKRQPDELYMYYGAGDLAITTPWYEPFGLTPLEAMACARPVIGSTVGGLAHTIVDGATGYLIPPRDPEALASRMQRVLHDRDLQERMGRVGRTRVERKFSWQLTAERTCALYETLLHADTHSTSGRGTVGVV
ncbi:MAG: glycosyltransferase, partial [Chloroflexota bacterium]|nr:glycosyltransferase [Chloroflexota bacterium]